MAGPNRPARLNRTLLTLLGLILLIAGAAVALFGTGLLAAVIPAVSTLDPSAPLFAGPPAPPTWAAYVAIVAAVLVGLSCLRWLLAQTLRRPKTGTWTLPRPGGHPDGDTVDAARGATQGGTRIASGHAADAVVADVTGYPGVNRASAHLTGAPQRPTLHLDVTAGPDASTTGLRQQIHDHALPRLRQALDLDDLHARMILRLDTHTPTRTR